MQVLRLNVRNGQIRFFFAVPHEDGIVSYNEKNSMITELPDWSHTITAIHDHMTSGFGSGLQNVCIMTEVSGLHPDFKTTK